MTLSMNRIVLNYVVKFGINIGMVFHTVTNIRWDSSTTIHIKCANINAHFVSDSSSQWQHQGARMHKPSKFMYVRKWLKILAPTKKGTNHRTTHIVAIKQSLQGALHSELNFPDVTFPSEANNILSTPLLPLRIAAPTPADYRQVT